jgi:hypothetical protein
MLTPSVQSVGGTFTCVGAYTATGDELGPDCLSPAEPAQVIWVATSGGDYTLLSEALAAIGTDLPAATSTEPYVIKIAPGVYDELSEVALKSFVDVEGSGEDVTIITCDCDGTTEGAATVSVDGITAQLRNLTVVNAGVGGSSYAAGITTRNVVDGAFSLLHVTARATGDSSNNFAVYNEDSSPSLMSVTAVATGSFFDVGVYNALSSSPTLTDVVALAGDGVGVNHGVFNRDTSSPTIRTSTITGSTTSINNYLADEFDDTSSRVADSLLDGPINVAGPFSGPFTCVGAYDASFVELDTDCLPI